MDVTPEVVDETPVHPDIQEAILFLPKTMGGHDSIKLKHLQSVCMGRDWGRQRERWGELKLNLTVQMSSSCGLSQSSNSCPKNSI